MFEDIIEKKKEIFGHWAQCKSCGMIFNVDQDGPTCPVCPNDGGELKEITHDQMQKIGAILIKSLTQKT